MEFEYGEDKQGKYVEFDMHRTRTEQTRVFELTSRDSDNEVIRRQIGIHTITRSKIGKTGNHHYLIRTDGCYEYKSNNVLGFFKIENGVASEVSEDEAMTKARKHHVVPKSMPVIGNKRVNLGEKEGKRSIYTGEFVRFGTKHGYTDMVETILLKDVRDEAGQLVTDHLWFNATKGFKKACLEAGDIVELRGRVELYVKGYKGYREDVCNPLEEDYKLSRPTKVRKIDGIKQIQG